MADAFSRVTWGGVGADGAARAIGTLLIVPAAGLTHAASGIGEAFLGGVPMLVITGGVRSDTPQRYKLHGVDKLDIARGFTKAAFRVQSHDEVVPTIFEAHRIATSGFSGPVLVEIPVDLQLFSASVAEPPAWQPPEVTAPDTAVITQAAELLARAKQVGLFVGWGARHAQAQLVELAELLNAPVATTLQGLAVFPADHPLHAGFGFSRSAVPAARHAFKGCDALLAVGTRFSEIPTGSFGAQVLFKDAALSQIAQAQQRPYQRLTCTELGQSIDLASVAQATGAACVLLPDDASAADAIAQARALAAEGRPVIVDGAIDYSKPTAFTLGTTQTTFGGFPLGQKLRFVKRMVGRRFFS